MKHSFSKKLLKQGIAASKAGQREQAERLLRQAIRLDTSNELAWLWLSAAVDSTHERRYCLENVLRLNPDSAHARAGMALLVQQAANTAAPVAASPVPIDSVSQRAQGLGIGDFCPLCSAAVTSQSTYCRHCGRDLVVTCPACESQRDLEETICDNCGYELGDYRQGSAYYANLGNVYLEGHNNDLAIIAWQTVLELDAGFPDAYLRLGEAQSMCSQWHDARASFEQAVSRSSDSSATYLAVGRLFEQGRQMDEAQYAYEHAVAVNESSTAAHYALGRLLTEGQAFQAAFPHIRHVTKLDPDHLGAWFLLGQLYELAEERRAAIQAYERAIELTTSEASDSNRWFQRASARLELLRPSLPPGVALNWPETVRQTASLALIPAVAALINAGLRPWQIAPTDYVGVLLAVLGAYLWVSASSLPLNPGMRAMLGQEGLSRPFLRTTVGLMGGLFWTTSLLYILLSPALSGPRAMG